MEFWNLKCIVEVLKIFLTGSNCEDVGEGLSTLITRTYGVDQAGKRRGYKKKTKVFNNQSQGIRISTKEWNVWMSGPISPLYDFCVKKSLSRGLNHKKKIYVMTDTRRRRQ